MRFVAGVLTLLLLTACPRVPGPERTIVNGREVFLIQEAPCFIGDCVASFYINRIQYSSTCGRLPDVFREEVSRGALFAVADPEVYDWRLPERRATVVSGLEPRWLVGVRIVGACGAKPRWSVAWPLWEAEAKAAICSSRPDIGNVLDFGCE